ncbi:MAG: hypothetical protein PVI06_03695 [Desulfobacterales bacterium]
MTHKKRSREEKDAVRETTKGQQVGLKISDFKRGKLGDLVECFESVRPKDEERWKPRGGVFFF